ncbi:MAG: hypothetical protein EPO68_00695 [Planctomycetota bacterium]|nr:MAG: hypothetical protein EPO68_00695 [Planctomycetota bacterium]
MSADPRLAALSAARDRVPIAELVDLGALERERGRALTPAELRGALPRGWVPDETDAGYARRDGRLLFSDGWILVTALVTFGCIGLFFLWSAMPRGWSGVARFGMLVGGVVLVGGLVAPRITRALQRR